MDEEGDSDLDYNALEELLAGAENENQDDQCQETSQPKNSSSFLEYLDDLSVNVPSGKTDKGKPALKEESVVHSGDTDSEDDEDKKYFHNRQFNEYGASIKKMLQAKEDSKNSGISGFSRGGSNSWKSAPKQTARTLCAPSGEVKQHVVDLNVDKLIGVRITNPIVSSTVLVERLQGRKIVPFSNMKNFTSNGKINEDWVVIGVIVSKSPPRTSSKGNTYSVIRLSDLRGVGDLKTVSLFLFSSACKTHSKNSVGSVLGILNPSIFDNSKSHGDEASLSVDSADRIMVLGTSRDFGFCKSKKKNGENCTSFVNKANCDFCVYHVKQEYQNCSRRSELQSSFTGKGLTGGLNGLRNKVLGKSEVFYGGQSFTAIPAKKSNKLAKQDNERLSILSGMSSAPRTRITKSKGLQGIASSVELSHRQAKKDLDRLRKLDDLGIGTDISGERTLPKASLQNFSQTVKVEESKSEILSFISKARESAASKPDVETAPEMMPLSEENSKVAPKTPTPLSRGAAFALAATQKKSGPQVNQASAFGLGRASLSKFAKSEDASPLNKPATAASISKTDDLVERSKDVKEDVSLTKSPAESKSLSRLTENRITKSMNSPKVAVKTEPPITKASELGLGRGRPGALTPRPSVSRVAPTISTAVPMLGSGISPNGVIEFDLSSPPSLTQKWTAPTGVKVSSSPKSSHSAKLKALNYVRAKGSITKEDPNKLELANKKKSVGNERAEPKKKRKIEQAVEASELGRKKVKSIEEEREKQKMAEFKALMEVTSKHVDLVAKADNEAKDEYFDKLERKEKMEEKMLNTYKVDCKAVTCTKCKYTAFSAADLCKEERHPLKVHDATKRFFKCADCGNRTCCLELIPLRTCSNCSGSRWERTAMIRERKVGIGSETLSIRGGEEKFIGSVVTGANLNLLVPE